MNKNHYRTLLMFLCDMQECDHSAKNASLDRLGLSDQEYDELIDWLTMKASDKDLREAPLFFDYKG